MKQSAGLLMVRHPGKAGGSTPDFLLAHPGGPYFARKDDGAWSIPKGLIEPGEAAEAAARREFGEETGFPITGPLYSLGHIDQSKKRVHAWMFIGDADPADLNSNEFEVEWPPRSGIKRRYPEIDRVCWYDPMLATQKILPAQAPLLLRAMAVVMKLTQG